MGLTRRTFVGGGLAAITAGVVSPAWWSRLALAQGSRSRILVLLDLMGGNDALSMVVPYTDPAYASRRPTLAIPAGRVLPIGRDSAGRDLGLHPRLGGLLDLFNRGMVAVIQRVGYENSSRSHFLGNDIWSTAAPLAPQGPGWLGRYLDALPQPVDPLVAWVTSGETPRTLVARTVRVPSIPSLAAYAFQAPNSGADAQYARAAARAMAGSAPSGAPQVTFVNSNVQAALATVDRVAAAGQYVPTVAYPPGGLAQALRTVAGAVAREAGASIFWVQTGGYDTHASQGTNESNGSYATLMGTLGDALAAFFTDLANQGLADRTLLLQYSEFGRRITENGSKGTDHGAAGVMLALGGRVRGGIYGTSPNLAPDPQNPTLENGGADVRHAIDFRSVYSKVAEEWIGTDPVGLLGGDFRDASPDFL